jgi:hypothetical protein
MRRIEIRLQHFLAIGQVIGAQVGRNAGKAATTMTDRRATCLTRLSRIICAFARNSVSVATLRDIAFGMCIVRLNN